MRRVFVLLLALPLLSLACNEDPPTSRIPDTDATLDTGDMDAADTATDTGPMVECTAGEDCASGVCEDTGSCAEPSCEDGVENQDETDVDCGGDTCEACQIDGACGEGDDCVTGVCQQGVCAGADCEDGVKNGEETAVDCGGSECAGCEVDATCEEGSDCNSGVCQADGVGDGEKSCAAPTCEDGVKNQDETDVDCGGGESGSGCEPCEATESCSNAEDCASGVCDETSGTCQAPTCADGVKNGGETGTDCGGAAADTGCPACEAGDSCSSGEDCKSTVCDEMSGQCQAPACDDGVKNGEESDVDCGGMCLGCTAGSNCGGKADCASGVCQMGACAAPTCSDGVKNGRETAVDCGGPASGCNACPAGQSCGQDADCASNICQQGTCAAASCTDGVKNSGESDVDCGGPVCGACAVGKSCDDGGDCVSQVCNGGQCAAPTCNDGQKNGQETDVDCGGPTCNACSTGGSCGKAADCVSGVCTTPQGGMKGGTCQKPTCTDGVTNGTESAVDCGGSCNACPAGKACNNLSDCQSSVCVGGQCQAPSCNDRVKNGSETDTDCGGGQCMGCQAGASCGGDGDCQSGVCANNQCQAPTCSDGVKNGGETDVDCGGASSGCSSCSAGDACSADGDCSSGVCTNNQCQAATCKDGVKNGGETDVDCGGAGSGCGKCKVGQSCSKRGDCTTGWCQNGTCRATASCKGLKGTGVNADGVYVIDPDGGGGTAPFEAYCDMTTGQGGWTLVMKLTSGTSTFGYATPYWEQTTLLNPNDLSPNTKPAGKNAKFPAFNHVKGQAMRLEWTDPNHDFTYAKLNNRTPLSLFQGPEVLEAGSERYACNGNALTSAPGYLGGKMRHARGRQFYGINGSVNGGDYKANLRFGFGSNDEPVNSWHPHQAIGTSVRGRKGQSILWNAHGDCNNCGCYGSGYAPSQTSGNLWVR